MIPQSLISQIVELYKNKWVMSNCWRKTIRKIKNQRGNSKWWSSLVYMKYRNQYKKKGVRKKKIMNYKI